MGTVKTMIQEQAQQLTNYSNAGLYHQELTVLFIVYVFIILLGLGVQYYQEKNKKNYWYLRVLLIFINMGWHARAAVKVVPHYLYIYTGQNKTFSDTLLYDILKFVIPYIIINVISIIISVAITMYNNKKRPQPVTTKDEPKLKEDTKTEPKDRNEGTKVEELSKPVKEVKPTEYTDEVKPYTEVKGELIGNVLKESELREVNQQSTEQEHPNIIDEPDIKGDEEEPTEESSFIIFIED